MFDDYIDRRGKRWSSLQVGLASGAFPIGSKRLQRSLNLDARAAAIKDAGAAEKQAVADAKEAASKPFEPPTSGPFRRAFDEQGRAMSGIEGVINRANYTDEERKKRLAQSGTNSKIFEL